MRYTILVSQTLDALIKQVEAHIQLHWQPQGGLVVFEAVHAQNDSACLYFAQAVVRTDAEE